MIEPDIIDRAVDLLRRQFPSVSAINLFGTAAADALRPDSDIGSSCFSWEFRARDQ
jgi:predicted nucleotidyltransferase